MPAKKISAVYIILQKSTNKVYVGSSKDVRQRMYYHRWELNRNQHSNEHLQKAWNACGESDFRFLPVFECPPDELIINEQRYMDTLLACDREFGFNIESQAGRPTQAAESKKKHSEALKRNTEFLAYASEHLRKVNADSSIQAKRAETLRTSPRAIAAREALNSSEEHKNQVQEMLDKLHSDPENMKRVANMAKNNAKNENWRKLHGVKSVLQRDSQGNILREFPSLNACNTAGFGYTGVKTACRKGTEFKGYWWSFKGAGDNDGE